MLDVDALERRWLKYKLKQFLPYLVYPVVVVAVGIGGIYLFKTVQFSKPLGIPTIAPKPTTTPLPSSPQLVIPKTVDRMEVKTVLEPSMQFVQTLPIPSVEEEIKTLAPVQVPKKVSVVAQQEVTIVKRGSVTPKKESATPKKEVMMVKKTVATQTVLEPKVKALKSTNKPPLIYPFAQTKPSSLTPPPSLHAASPMRGSTSVQYPATLDIHEMEDRFKNNNSPYVGLYIARYYYDHGNYNDAYNYALKTNALNNSMEESWLLVAKSLVKLGKTDQAKRALQVYVTQSNSERARNLLDNLEGGGR